ncbi:MAG: TonB-dependent receptor [bacterium]|nr:TonB-dependent receptor [bacterium]MDD5756209.1 TonB-dependent receptor [bacterium]
MFSHKIITLLTLVLLIAVHPVSAEEGAEVNLNMTVSAASLSPQPVHLTGTNVTVIKAEDIAAAHTQDISQLLNQAAGLDLPKQASMGNAQTLSIRGVPGQQVLILLDGFPLNSPSLGLSDLSQIPLENIEAIEIVRGAGSAIYGANAIGGVVNIITKKSPGPKPLTDISLLAGSHNTQTYRFSFGAKPGNLDYAVSASRSFSNGWRKNNDFDNNALSGRIGYDLHRYGKISLHNQYYRSFLGLPGPSNVPIDTWDNALEREASSPNARQEDRTNITYAEYKVMLCGQTAAKVRMFLNDTKQIYRNTDWSLDNLRRNRSHGASTQLDLVSGWSAGLEYRQDSVWQRDDNIQADTINEAVFFQSLYGQYMRQMEAWLYTIGARYDHHSISGGQFNPRLSLVYLLNSTWKASLNIARGFRPPTVNDLFWPLNQESFFGLTYITVGNKNLSAEKAMSYDLGLEGKFSDSCQGKATLFYIASKDLMLWRQENVTLTTYRYSPQNIAQGKNVGLEVEANQALFSALKHKLVYTAMQAQGKNNSDPDYLLLAFHAKHKLSYQLDYLPKETVQISIRNQFQSASFEQDGERGLKIPSANIWSAALQKKINSAVFAFKADNLFNKRYAVRTDGFGNYYPLPGRTYWFSCDLPFEN